MISNVSENSAGDLFDLNSLMYKILQVDNENGIYLIFYIHVRLISIASLYFNYCLSKRMYYEQRIFIDINGEILEAFPVMNTDNKLIVCKDVFVGVYRNGDYNDYFLALKCGNTHLVLSFAIINRLSWKLNIVNINDKLDWKTIKNWKSIIYSYYKGIDTEIDPSIQQLNEEFLQYKESCMLLPCFFDDALCLDMIITGSVNRFGTNGSFVRSYHMSKSFSVSTHIINNVKDADHIVHYVSFFKDESFKNCVCLMFNNMGYKYIHNEDYSSFLKSVCSFNFPEIETIDIINDFDRINSYGAYSNSCWLIAEVFHAAYQLTIMTHKDISLTTDLRPLLHKNAFIVAKLWIRHFVCLALKNDMTVSEALKTPLFNNIANGKYQEYFTLVLSSEYAHSCYKYCVIGAEDIMFINDFEFIEESGEDLTKLMAVLKVLFIGVKLQYYFKIENNEIVCKFKLPNRNNIHKLFDNTAVKLKNNTDVKTNGNGKYILSFIAILLLIAVIIFY